MKDLKNEYIKLTEENVPDLWDRIESKIDEIESDKNVLEKTNKDNADNIVDISSKTNDTTKDVINKKTNKKVKRYIPAIISAAAVLLLSVGALGVINSSKNYSASAPSAAADINYEAAAESAAEEACDMSDESPSYEMSDKAPSYEETNKTATMAESTMDATNEALADDEAQIEEAVGAEDTDYIEYIGTLTFADEDTINEAKDVEYIIITLDDGSTKTLYVPENLRNDVYDAVNSLEEYTISCSKLTTDMIEEFSINEDVKLYIDAIFK